ncbi:hypothetical protein OG21DRAFT_1399272, partial [Imleria badia]
MPRRQPRKKATIRNTAGLQNQTYSGLKRPQSESEPNELDHGHLKKRSHHDESGAVSSDEEWELTTMFDSIKFVASHDKSESESSADSELEDRDSGLLFISDEHATYSCLINFAISLGDSEDLRLSDETWLPPREA